MDLSLLETLRYKIATGKVFADTFEFFFDHFGEDADFVALGEPANDDMLLKLLGHVGSAIFKTDKVRLDNLRLIRIAEYDFIHGGMTINGAMANVIYCNDLQQGILVVFRPQSNPPTQFVRFSAEMLTAIPGGGEGDFKH